MRKRYYIFIVTHDWDGQLRRIPIPVQWVVLFVAFAVLGAGTLLGLAGSYGRMVTKVQSFNEMRTRQDALVKQLVNARQDAAQFHTEVASLGSLASEVTSLYNFKHNASLKDRLRNSTSDAASDITGDVSAEQGETDNPQGDALTLFNNTLNNFQILQTTALENSLPQRQWSPFGAGTWEPDMWPVQGRITSSFGQRIDPFLGEGAFHAGMDIGASFGTPVHVTADGVVVFSGVENGYGKLVIVDHGHGIRTFYGHLSARDVTVGEHVDRDEVIGLVGQTGRATAPHLHYEVRINQAPVNPYRYLHP